MARARRAVDPPRRDRPRRARWPPSSARWTRSGPPSEADSSPTPRGWARRSPTSVREWFDGPSRLAHRDRRQVGRGGRADGGRAGRVDAADPRGPDGRGHRLAARLQPRRGQGGDHRPRRQGGVGRCRRRPTSSSSATAPGSKADKAEQLGVPILDEDGFRMLLEPDRRRLTRRPRRSPRLRSTTRSATGRCASRSGVAARRPRVLVVDRAVDPRVVGADVVAPAGRPDVDVRRSGGARRLRSISVSARFTCSAYAWSPRARGAGAGVVGRDDLRVADHEHLRLRRPLAHLADQAGDRAWPCGQSLSRRRSRSQPGRWHGAPAGHGRAAQAAFARRPKTTRRYRRRRWVRGRRSGFDRGELWRHVGELAAPEVRGASRRRSCGRRGPAPSCSPRSRGSCSRSGSSRSPRRCTGTSGAAA